MYLSTTAIIALILTPVLYLFSLWLKWYLDFRRKLRYLSKLPQFETHWLWGNLHKHPGPNQAGLMYERENCKKFPYLYLEWYGPFDARITTHHPVTVAKILKTSEPKPMRTGVGSYRLLLQWLGDGLLLSRGSKWARNRRLLTPAFHFDILKPYMTINNKCADVFLKKLSKWEEKGESFDLFRHISYLTLDVIMKCAFSYEEDCQNDGPGNEYANKIFRLCHLAADRFLKPWQVFDTVFNLMSEGREHQKLCDYVHNVADEIIKKRKQTLAQSGENILRNRKYLDFLDILLTAKDADGKGLSDDEIRAETDTFLFEGHDTTASGISWLLYVLATNPEYQRKCQDEVDRVMREKDTDYIEWDDLPKLEYLTMCLKESLRMYCAVPFIGRELTQDTEIAGYVLPKGCTVDCRIWSLHHNGLVWEDDMVFKPERFLPDAMQKMDPFAFVPFSAGPRNCIGQNFALHEMKTVVARILHKYHLELEAGQNVKQRPALVMKTSEKVKMKVIPRY